MNICALRFAAARYNVYRHYSIIFCKSEQKHVIVLLFFAQIIHIPISLYSFFVFCIYIDCIVFLFFAFSWAAVLVFLFFLVYY